MCERCPTGRDKEPRPGRPTMATGQPPRPSATPTQFATCAGTTRNTGRTPVPQPSGYRIRPGPVSDEEVGIGDSSTNRQYVLASTQRVLSPHNGVRASPRGTELGARILRRRRTPLHRKLLQRRQVPRRPAHQALRFPISKSEYRPTITGKDRATGHSDNVTPQPPPRPRSRAGASQGHHSNQRHVINIVTSRKRKTP